MRMPYRVKISDKKYIDEYKQYLMKQYVIKTNLRSRNVYSMNNRVWEIIKKQLSSLEQSK